MCVDYMQVLILHHFMSGTWVSADFGTQGASWSQSPMATEGHTPHLHAAPRASALCTVSASCLDYAWPPPNPGQRSPPVPELFLLCAMQWGSGEGKGGPQVAARIPPETSFQSTSDWRHYLACPTFHFHICKVKVILSILKSCEN